MKKIQNNKNKQIQINTNMYNHTSILRTFLEQISEATDKRCSSQLHFVYIQCKSDYKLGMLYYCILVYSYSVQVFYTVKLVYFSVQLQCTSILHCQFSVFQCIVTVYKYFTLSNQCIVTVYKYFTLSNQCILVYIYSVQVFYTVRLDSVLH